MPIAAKLMLLYQFIRVLPFLQPAFEVYQQVSASGSSNNRLTISQATRADYRLLGLLGQGQFAQVFCAVYRRTGRLVAIKETRHTRQHPSQESVILPSLNHPNIIGCQAVFKTKRGYRLVLEYCEAGTLRSHLNSKQNTAGHFSLPEIQSLMSDLLSALGYLHQHGIAHGDLKPENLFLTWQKLSPKSTPNNNKTQSRLTLKIGDFGNALFLDRAEDRSANFDQHDVQGQAQPLASAPSIAPKEIGSPSYAAPERFETLPSTASDLYAVGIMLYELMLGDRPFSGPPDVLKKAHKTTTPAFPAHLTPQAKQLLAKALHKQPKKRFSSAEDMQSALLQLSTITTKPADSVDVSTSAILTNIPETSLSQVMTTVPSNGITAPIEALIHVPQGCCIITDRSLHLLTPRRKLLSIARFQQPCWITVASNGKWFAAATKKGENISPKAVSAKRDRYRFSQGMIGHLSNRSGHTWRRNITLKGKLLTELCARVIKLVALDNRYLLRISTTQSKTFFECFTRRGQFVGELSINFRLIQVSTTTVPYQLVAIRAPQPDNPQPGVVDGRNTTQNAHRSTHRKAERTGSDSVVFIRLKPFQVRIVSLPVVAEQISALPWGYLVSYQRSALLLDRSAQLTSILTGLPLASKAATLSTRSLLLTNSMLSSTVASPTHQAPIAYKSSEPMSLLVADTSALDLGLIF